MSNTEKNTRCVTELINNILSYRLMIKEMEYYISPKATVLTAAC